MNIEQFAKDWIYELVATKGIVERCYQQKDEHWKKSIEYAIERRAWYECYRKVSQLCHAIGGDTLTLFKRQFPEGVNSYIESKE